MMNNDTPLSEIAKKIAQSGGEVEYFNNQPTTEQVYVEPTHEETHTNFMSNDLTETATASVDLDQPAIIIGTPIAQTKPDEVPYPHLPSTTVEHSVQNATPIKIEDDSILGTVNPVTLSDEELEALAPNMPDTERKRVADKLLLDKATYIKKLIMSGFTPDEAEEAAAANIKKGISSADAEYQAAHPTNAVIEINKTTGVSDLGLTQEEHNKLQKVRTIKLITVEDVELKSIKVKPIDAAHKVDYIRSIDNSLSQYSVPLPMLGDFISFRGAQIVQLANAIEYEDNKLDESITRKANLIYDKIISGTLVKKNDENNKVTLSYAEFVNLFPYQDLDMALFGILCASSTEESSTVLHCNACGHDWDQKYNLKTLLQMDGLSDDIKQRYDDILSHRSDHTTLQKMHNDMKAARRYKSPFTNNIYDITYPTIARAVNILRKIDQEDSVQVYNSALALYMNALYIYDAKMDDYLMIDENEVDTMLSTILTLPDDDIQMLLAQAQKEISYTPSFAIKTACPACKKTHTINVGIDQLVFLKAQDSLKAIQ